MALSVTKLVGPYVNGGVHEAIFNVTPDDSWLAAGEALDLTDYFSEIYAIEVGGSKVIAGYKVGFIIPDSGTDISSSNVLMTAHYSTDAAGAMTAVPNATDLSTVLANTRVVVKGKIADPA